MLILSLFEEQGKGGHITYDKKTFLDETARILASTFPDLDQGRHAAVGELSASSSPQAAAPAPLKDA
eukprot:7949725-Prorocentrum_lima.AAC.1